MFSMLARNWWVMIVRGLAAILFGLLAIVWPGLTVAALVLMFGAYAIVDGLFGFVTALKERKTREHWWLLLLEGLMGIAAGILTFVWPQITALALLYVIAAWAVVTGVLEIWAAVRLRKEIKGEWALVLGGIASLVFGGILLFQPGAGALAVIWMIAAYAVVFGILMVVLGFRLQKMASNKPATAPAG